MNNNLPITEEEKQKRTLHAEEQFRDLIRMLGSFQTTMDKISCAMLAQDLPEVMKHIRELKEKTQDEQNKNRTVK